MQEDDQRASYAKEDEHEVAAAGCSTRRPRAGGVGRGGESTSSRPRCSARIDGETEHIHISRQALHRAPQWVLYTSQAVKVDANIEVLWR